MVRRKEGMERGCSGTSIRNSDHCMRTIDSMGGGGEGMKGYCATRTSKRSISRSHERGAICTGDSAATRGYKGMSMDG